MIFYALVKYTGEKNVKTYEKFAHQGRLLDFQNLEGRIWQGGREIPEG